jgi:hypothetical protein
MRFRFFMVALMVTSMSTIAFASEDDNHDDGDVHVHSDVEFGYDSLENPTELEIEVGEATATGVPFFESSFVIEDSVGDPGNYTSDSPGFATAPTEEVPLVINAGDQIFANVLDSSVGALFGGKGFVTYYDPVEDSLSAAGRISVTGESPSFPTAFLNGDSVESGSTLQFVDVGPADPFGSPSFDEHLVFDLLDDATAAPGAYGLLLQLQSNFAGTDLSEFELISEPFWVILNHQMDEEDFENFAVPAFETAAIPEPGTASLLAMGAATALLRRRRS